MASGKKKVETSPIFPRTPFIEEIGSRLLPYQREIMGGVLLLITVITLLSLLTLTEDAFSDWWATLFTYLFGWGAIPAALLLGGLGVLLTFGRLSEETRTIPLDLVIGVELLFVVILAVVHMTAAPDSQQALRLVRGGAGGGLVGWGISTFLVDLIGMPPTGLILLVVGLAALGLTFRLNVMDVAYWTERAGEWAQQRLGSLQEDNDEGSDLDSSVEVASPANKKRAKAAAREKRPAEPKPTMTAEAALAALPKARHALPPVDLLAPPAKDPAQTANSRYQAQIIEETLYGFGIPAEVVEINRGPTVTQFGLKLGTLERKLPDGNVVEQRVRVNKVVSLTNDLALALSAAPIRIEAPVPGRPLVGIEIPNSEKTLVSLRAVLEDSGFKKDNGGLRIALGRGVSGQPVSAPLAQMPHLLIAGATGSGKSVCINAIISTLLFTHAPEQLRFLMIDPKMVELTSFNGIPHLLAPVVTDFEQVVGALAWVTREMERRYKLFAATGSRSINSYNRKVGARGERLPYLVIVIDELADLMMMAPDEVERHICRIAQMARATGIHLVIATQRPSVDVVTGLIKANFPTRIAFAVTSQIDSRVILDTPGAEKLLGQGDMLYMASDSPKLARLQGCFLSDAEINNIVSYWQAAKATFIDQADEAEADPAEAEPPWAGLMAEADKDDLLDKAIELIVAENRASTSLLQRRLGIGYPRASRLMDQLEAEGVIGPADGSKPREVFNQDEQDEADYDGFEDDVAGS
jgi:S-DNA-T family DNA segregation ATPase FtsK/SpoIIIE